MRQWINLFESVAWWQLSEEQLRAFASQYVGLATDDMGDPADLKWAVESLPTDLFANYNFDFDFYFRDEVMGRVQNRKYDASFLDASFHTPIVVSFEPDLILWDGYHRVAIALHRGDQTIMAVVGRS